MKEKKSRGIAVTVLLTFFAMTFAATQYTIPTILTPLTVEYGISYTTASWFITAFSLASVVVALPAGPVAVRIGVKRALLLSAIISLCGAGLGILIHHPAALIAARALEGVGFGLVCAGGPILIEKIVPHERQSTANGIWSSWIPLGCTIGEIFSPTIYDSLGSIGLWFVFAALMLGFTIAFLVFVKVPAPERSAFSESEQKKTAPLLSGIFSLKFLLFLFGFLTFNILNFCLVSYAPSYMQGIGLDASLSGLIASVPMILSIATQPIGGVLIDRFGHKKQIMVVALIVNAIATPLMFISTGAGLWASSLAIGLIGSLTFVSSLSAVSDVIGDRRFYALGVSSYMFIECSGEFIGGLVPPLLLGPASSDWIQLAGGLLVLGSMGVVATIACRFQPEKLAQ